MTTLTRLIALNEAQCARFADLVGLGVATDDARYVALRDAASGRDLGDIPSPRPVANKRELASVLEEQLVAVLAKNPMMREDPGLWNALTLHWLPFIGGKSAQQSPEFLVFMSAGRDRYRHRLAGPYFLAQSFKDDPSVSGLLQALPADAHGEMLEQLLSRQYVLISRAAWGMAARLYLDGEGKIKRGAAGRKAGSVRRFAIVMQQLAVTYDTSLIDVETLERLLPPEFERFSA